MLMLPGHGSEIHALAYTPDGMTLATGGADGTVRLWDLAAGTERLRLRSSRFAVRGVAWSLDGATILASDHAEVIRTWDAHSGEPGEVFRRRSGAIGAMVIGVLLGGATSNPVDPARLRRAEAAGWRLSRARAYSMPDPVEGVGFDGLTDFDRRVCCFPNEAQPEYVSLDSGLGDRGILLTPTTANGAKVGAYVPGSGIRVGSYRDNGVAFSADEQAYAFCSGKILHVWDVKRPRILPLRQHRDSVRSLAFAPDGRTLVSGGEDGLVCLWDLGHKSGPTRFDWEIGMIDAVAFSPDGSTVAAGGRTGIVVWDVAEDHFS